MDITDRVQLALQALRQGSFVIVVDEHEPGASGDLVLAASEATGERLNFMMREARGLMAVAMTPERLDELDLPPMVSDAWQEEGDRAAFAVSVDARAGGDDSAVGKATTIAALVNPHTTPRDLLRPGHVLPVRAAPGGTLVRAGHTEAALDLMRLAELYPAAVLCRILSVEGQPAALPQLQEFAARYELPFVSIADLIARRRLTEKLVVQQAQAHLPTIFGEFRVVIYSSVLDGADFIALCKGDVATCEAPLVRVHSGCVTGDLLGSLKCDCGWQLSAALQRIEAEGCGVVLYIPGHEGRGIGLANKIRAYHLQDCGLDTVEANVALGFAPDLRDYGLGAQVLADLGITRMRLMTNNPAKYTALTGHGLEVVERVPLVSPGNEHNLRYLLTKRDKMGHLLHGDTQEGE
jgi:3,4-dihydroxy 2-butanone 4-phosphate synthase/GTP cyclohydrolase II